MENLYRNKAKEIWRITFNLLLRCNYDLIKQENLSNLNNFYKEVLSRWREVKTCNNENNDEILWNNKDIIIGDKSVFYKIFFEIGITYIKHLYVGDTSMISLNYWQRNGLPKNAYIHLKWLSLRSEVNSKRKAVICCDDNVEKFIQNPILIKCIDGKERVVSTLKAKQFYQILSNNQVTYPTKSIN